MESVGKIQPVSTAPSLLSRPQTLLKATTLVAIRLHRLHTHTLEELCVPQPSDLRYLSLEPSELLYLSLTIFIFRRVFHVINRNLIFLTFRLDTPLFIFNVAMSFDAEHAGNAEEIEMQFAVKTVEHLEVSVIRIPSYTYLHLLLLLMRRLKAFVVFF